MKRFRGPITVFVLAAWLGIPVETDAATINFASLSQAGTGYREFGNSLTHDGFIFTSSYELGGPGLIVWQASSTFHPAGGDATTSLMEYTASHTTTIARSGGAAFDLAGIDLANYGTGAFANATFAVTFTGTRSDASVVTQTFNVDNIGAGEPLALQSFTFSGFTDLVKVQVTQGTYATGTAFQFNNLVVDQQVTAVPELASVWALASGAIVVAAGWRKRRRG
jgi:hypothetical protein